METGYGITCQRAQDDRIEGRGDAGIQVARSDDGACHDGVQKFVVIVVAERGAARDTFVQQDAERVLIALRRCLVPANHFGRHIKYGACNTVRRCCGLGAVTCLGDPEVHDNRFHAAAAPSEEDIRRFEISVDDTRVVSCCHRRRDRQQEICRFDDGKRALARKPFGQILALEQLHDEKRESTLRSNVEDRHHVRVADGGCSATLTHHTTNGSRIDGGVFVNHFDGNSRAKLHVARFEHFTHRAATEKARSLVATETPVAREK